MMQQPLGRVFCAGGLLRAAPAAFGRSVFDAVAATAASSRGVRPRPELSALTGAESMLVTLTQVEHGGTPCVELAAAGAGGGCGAVAGSGAQTGGLLVLPFGRAVTSTSHSLSTSRLDRLHVIRDKRHSAAAETVSPVASC